MISMPWRIRRTTQRHQDEAPSNLLHSGQEARRMVLDVHSASRHFLNSEIRNWLDQGIEILQKANDASLVSTRVQI